MAEIDGGLELLEAIKIAEQLKAGSLAARALGGLGEALFRAGRYSQAIARYKTAAQADPAAAVVVAEFRQLLRADTARRQLR